MQARHGTLRYALDDWPPLSPTILFGLQWAAIVIPSIIVLGHVVAAQANFYETLKRGEAYTGYYSVPFQEIVAIYSRLRDGKSPGRN